MLYFFLLEFDNASNLFLREKTERNKIENTL